MSNPSAEEVRFVKERERSLASYKATLDGRDSELAEARKTVGPASMRWQEWDSQRRSAEGTCQAIFAALNRLTDGKRISSWVMLLLAVGFAALEAPINKFMLDNILQGNNFDSYALSLFLTLIMLLLAHIAGTQARQIKGTYEEKIYWGKVVTSFILLCILSTCIGALTIGRAYYSTAGQVATLSANIFSEIGARVIRVGPWTALLAALTDEAAFFLASLNLAGIAGAFFLAFVSHDSDVVYQAALDEAEKAQRKLSRLAKKYDKRLADIGRKRHKKLVNLQAAYGAQNAEVISRKIARGESLADMDSIDLAAYDSLLRRVREELVEESKEGFITRPARIKSRDDQNKIIPQVVALDRK